MRVSLRWALVAALAWPATLAAQGSPVVHRGSLGSGDSQLRSGEFYDRYTFEGRAGQRMVFALLRLLQPNLVLKRRTIVSYANNGITAIATRHADVTDILSRDADFGVVYGPRMEMITGGENFFLGMQDTPRYTRDTSNMRLVVRRDDVPGIVTPYVSGAAAEIVAMVPGKIDVPQALTQPVAAGLLDTRFEIRRDRTAAYLRGERDVFEGKRQLLGKATAFVGRGREMSMLTDLYAGTLAGRAAAGWHGRRAAYFAIAGFAALVVTLGAGLFIPGRHGS